MGLVWKIFQDLAKLAKQQQQQNIHTHGSKGGLAERVTDRDRQAGRKTDQNNRLIEREMERLNLNFLPKLDRLTDT